MRSHFSPAKYGYLAEHDSWRAGKEDSPLVETLRGSFGLPDKLATALSYGIAHSSSPNGGSNRPMGIISTTRLLDLNFDRSNPLIPHPHVSLPSVYREVRFISIFDRQIRRSWGNRSGILSVSGVDFAECAERGAVDIWN